jgi:hypothetical protein
MELSELTRLGAGASAYKAVFFSGHQRKSTSPFVITAPTGQRVVLTGLYGLGNNNTYLTVDSDGDTVITAQRLMEPTGPAETTGSFLIGQNSGNYIELTGVMPPLSGSVITITHTGGSLDYSYAYMFVKPI